MKKEHRQITVTAYRDSKGNPTCAGDFTTGDVCPFYRTQRMGCNETCVFAEQDGKYWRTLDRRDKGDGSLIPCEQCPIWNSSKQS